MIGHLNVHDVDDTEEVDQSDYESDGSDLQCVEYDVTSTFMNLMASSINWKECHIELQDR